MSLLTWPLQWCWRNSTISVQLFWTIENNVATEQSRLITHGWRTFKWRSQTQLVQLHQRMLTDILPPSLPRPLRWYQGWQRQPQMSGQELSQTVSPTPTCKYRVTVTGSVQHMAHLQSNARPAPESSAFSTCITRYSLHVISLLHMLFSHTSTLFLKKSSTLCFPLRLTQVSVFSHCSRGWL